MITAVHNEIMGDIAELVQIHKTAPATGVGVDLNTRFLAVAAVDDHDVVATLAYDLPEGRVARAYHVSAGLRVFMERFAQVQRVSVEIPFFTKNVNTGKMLHELASAAAIGAFTSLIEHMQGDSQVTDIEYVDNNKWKSYVHGTSYKIEKLHTKEWAHKFYPNYIGVPDKVKVISRGPRKGHEERSISDMYDAIALANYACRR